MKKLSVWQLQSETKKTMKSKDRWEAVPGKTHGLSPAQAFMEKQIASPSDVGGFNGDDLDLFIAKWKVPVLRSLWMFQTPMSSSMWLPPRLRMILTGA